MDWLEAAAGNGYPCGPLFESDPLIAPLRGQPRFTRLMEDLMTQREELRRLYLALK
jgi:hypothetical protein